MDELEQKRNIDFAISLDETECRLADRILTLVLQQNKNNTLANFYLGRLAEKFDQTEKAIKYYDAACKTEQAAAEHVEHFIFALCKIRDFKKARSILKMKSSLLSDTEWFFNFIKQGELANTGAPSKKTTNKDSNVNELNNIVELLQAGRLTLALRRAEKMLEKFPGTVLLHSISGAANSGLFQYEKAIKSFRKALALEPKNPENLNNLGVALANIGELEEARNCFEKALAIKPEYAEAIRHMSEITNFSDNTDLIEQFEYVANCSSVTADKKSQILFALGKAYRDIENFQRSYECYLEGNAISKELSSYDIKRDIKIFQRLGKVASDILKVQDLGLNSDEYTRPIFIVGMPRSGTSLIEQILSSHPEVKAGGELPFVKNLGGELALGIGDINTDRLKTFRETYQKKIESVSDNRKVVTDKMPHNFMFVPLIAQALPHAKIIHVVRDPVATCWSNFTHFFTNDGLSYSNDLDDLEQYYQIYFDLMSKWVNEFKLKIHTCNYEKLVNNPETEIRKMIQFVDLDWNEQCLFPHENKRQVNTASYLQVNRRIYQNSSSNWKQYGDLLDKKLLSLRQLPIEITR